MTTLLFLVLLSQITSADAGVATSQESVMFDDHPGAVRPYPDELRSRLADALAAQGEDYEPRTHHLRDDGSPVWLNRLILEDSPYLVQHAHNPVNWYPWGEEAFARAKAEDKPIFLSIGYSTCHWCHVMERESFEDVEVARLLNEKFIAIKLDREQRPDLDDFYMTGVQLMTRQSGGWPMSSFLTPEAKPFYGGTYYPRDAFLRVLGALADSWQAQRAEILASADSVTEEIRRITSARGEASDVGEEAVRRAVKEILLRHDPEYGGFGDAPKFPNEPDLIFLLQQVERGAHPEAWTSLRTTLDAMARGGIYDQVGGGFHRYSVDEFWLVPHFEKMLYNQAHLSRAYLSAYRLGGDRADERVVRQTLDYVLREMTAPDGGFYSATDADSEGEEGAFFLWTPEQLRAALSEEDAALAIDLWDVRPGGNFEGRTILNLPVGLAEFADSREMKLDDLERRVDAIRETLWQEREKREHPLRDDKIITAWASMMITAFAQAGDALGEPRYLEAASRAADFLWRANRREDGRLWRAHLDGNSSIDAVQDDYAYLAEALLTLHDVASDAEERARRLDQCVQIVEKMIELFADAEHGGFYMSAEGVDPHLLSRPKSPMDSAIPSGNSVAVRVLVRLAARTGEDAWSDLANGSIRAFSESIGRFPNAFSYMLAGVDDWIRGEAGMRQWGARGHVAASVRADEGRFEIRLNIEEGWHVNSDAPLQDLLIATTMAVPEGWELRDTKFPEGKVVQLGFQDDPVSVYEGDVEISARVTGEGVGKILPIELDVQACNDRLCLRPETITFHVPLVALGL